MAAPPAPPGAATAAVPSLRATAMSARAWPAKRLRARPASSLGPAVPAPGATAQRSAHQRSSPSAHGLRRAPTALVALPLTQKPSMAFMLKRLHIHLILGSMMSLFVSGDGVMAAVSKEQHFLVDCQTAIKVPLGIILSGTGNGMTRSLLLAAGEPFSVSNDVFAIIRGHKCALDVTPVVQGKTRFFSVLMFTWGPVADIDIESEKYRWMGSARLEFYVSRLHSERSLPHRPKIHSFLDLRMEAIFSPFVNEHWSIVSDVVSI